MTPEQIIFIGFVASVFTFALTQLAHWFDYRPGRLELTIVLYIVSLLLGWIWTGVVVPLFPAFSDVLTFVSALTAYISAWIAAVTPVLGAATLIYNLLYEKVVVPLAEKFQNWKAKSEIEAPQG